jgi:hypothetical protein
VPRQSELRSVRTADDKQAFAVGTTGANALRRAEGLPFGAERDGLRQLAMGFSGCAGMVWRQILKQEQAHKRTPFVKAVERAKAEF